MIESIKTYVAEVLWSWQYLYKSGNAINKAAMIYILPIWPMIILSIIGYFEIRRKSCQEETEEDQLVKVPETGAVAARAGDRAGKARAGEPGADAVGADRW